jgi:anti-anti-sigma factor
MKQAPGQFSISHEASDSGIVLVKLAGKMLLGTESQRLETLVPELIAQGHRRFIFDLSGLTHIDSTGIGRFIFTLNVVMQAGGRMCLSGAAGYVREGFRVTRLDTVFQFLPDIEAARKCLISGN